MIYMAGKLRISSMLWYNLYAFVVEFMVPEICTSGLTELIQVEIGEMCGFERAGKCGKMLINSARLGRLCARICGILGWILARPRVFLLSAPLSQCRFLLVQDPRILQILACRILGQHPYTD